MGWSGLCFLLAVFFISRDRDAVSKWGKFRYTDVFVPCFSIPSIVFTPICFSSFRPFVYMAGTPPPSPLRYVPLFFVFRFSFFVFFFFSHPMYYRGPSFFLSPLVVTQIRGHIAGSFPPLPTTVRALHFCVEKISALSSLVDSRRFFCGGLHSRCFSIMVRMPPPIALGPA